MKISPLLIIGIVLGTLVVGGIVAYTLMVSTGRIVTFNVDAFADLACTQKISAIQWGDVAAGESVTRTIYVKHTGNNKNMTLSMMSQNFNPTAASNYLTLTWDQEGATLLPGESVTAMLVLSTSPDTEGFTNFSFDIVISGTG